MRYHFADSVLGTWKLGALYGESDSVKNAESYATEFKMYYRLSSGLSGFAVGVWQQNKFAGIDRRLHGGLGAGYAFLDGPRNTLAGEIGVNYVVDEYTDSTGKEYPEGRAFGKYTWAFTDRTRFSQAARAALLPTDSPASSLRVCPQVMAACRPLPIHRGTQKVPQRGDLIVRNLSAQQTHAVDRPLPLTRGVFVAFQRGQDVAAPANRFEQCFGFWFGRRAVDQGGPCRGRRRGGACGYDQQAADACQKQGRAARCLVASPGTVPPGTF